MIKVLDKGYVDLVAHMGDDLLVVNAARVSFDKRSSWVLEEFADNWTPTVGKLRKGDISLINFLATHGHWSPFAHPQLCFEVKAPLIVARQWYKHRTGMTYTDAEDREMWEEAIEDFDPDREGWNEKSFRYVEPDDFYIPDVWRSAPDNKKQGSGPPIEDQWSTTALTNNLNIGRVYDIADYHEALERGVAPEQARLFLPANAQYTFFYWTTSLKGVLRFLRLRLPSDAQFEIRQFANVIYELAQPLFPYSFAAYKMEELRG